MTVATALQADAPPSDATGKYAQAASLVKMTPEVLREICMERHMWSQPHLNTQLFLNYKGFEAISGLENYLAVRSLHLGNNNIARIQGLDRMSDLRSLHLEGNRIRVIENLESNLELRQLNLENNGIQSVGCLDYLVKLEQLNIAKNNVESLPDLEGLRSLPKLANIDVSHNRIEGSEGVVEFWTEMAANLKVLRYHGNPGVRHIDHYRKRLVNALPDLTYLDERPVMPVERRSCAAWAEGGLEAMHQAKRDFHGERQRMETTVDPDRREFLTRMRKAAIARIEREAKEKEEEEERKRSGKQSQETPGDTAPSTSQGGADAAAEESQQPESRPASRLAFAPPARRAVSSQRRLPAEPQGASSFISSNQGEKAEDQLLDRQFAVLGDDPWSGTEVVHDHTSRRLQRELSAGVHGGQDPSQEEVKSTGEVIPQIWERLGPSSKREELKALEQNLSHSRGATVSEAPFSGPVDNSELASLD